MTGTGAFAIAHGFVAEQQGKPGERALTLVQFHSNDPYEVLHDAVPIGKVPELRGSKWVATGWNPRWVASSSGTPSSPATRCNVYFTKCIVYFTSRR